MNLQDEFIKDRLTEHVYIIILSIHIEPFFLCPTRQRFFSRKPLS